MPFNLFGRRGRTNDATATTGPGTTGNGTTTATDRTPRRGGYKEGFRGRNHGTYPDSLNSRPTFGQWLKGVWLDILTMAALGAIGLGVGAYTFHLVFT